MSSYRVIIALRFTMLSYVAATCGHAVCIHLSRSAGSGGRQEGDLRSECPMSCARIPQGHSRGADAMQLDEDIQYAPRSRPVSFYDNYKVRFYPRGFVYMCESCLLLYYEEILRDTINAIRLAVINHRDDNFCVF